MVKEPIVNIFDVEKRFVIKNRLLKKYQDVKTFVREGNPPYIIVKLFFIV